MVPRAIKIMMPTTKSVNIHASDWGGIKGRVVVVVVVIIFVSPSSPIS